VALPPPSGLSPSPKVYVKEIGDLLLRMPRPLLLLLKTNDCLRSVDHTLGSPLNTVGRARARAGGGGWGREGQPACTHARARRRVPIPAHSPPPPKPRALRRQPLLTPIARLPLSPNRW
jgi:hypothetical protein